MVRTAGVLVFTYCLLCQDTLAFSSLERTKRWENDPLCGKPVKRPSLPTVGGRVVGGDQAQPHSWPWQVSLICATPRNATLCGGSVISTQWIITAAHCILTDTYNIYKDCNVGVGKHFLRLKVKEAAERNFQISEYIIHDRYKSKDIVAGYDLALAKVSGKIEFNAYVRPICLPLGQKEPSSESLCMSSGWGYISADTVSTSQFLKQLHMPIQEATYCGFTRKAAAADIIICAGKWHRKEDLCFGDSGGPLQCQSDDKWYLHGVLSEVDKKCNSVASFTKIVKFQDWIELHIL